MKRIANVRPLGYANHHQHTNYYRTSGGRWAFHAHAEVCEVTFDDGTVKRMTRASVDGARHAEAFADKWTPMIGQVFAGWLDGAAWSGELKSIKAAAGMLVFRTRSGKRVEAATGFEQMSHEAWDAKLAEMRRTGQIPDDFEIL